MLTLSSTRLQSLTEVTIASGIWRVTDDSQFSLASRKNVLLISRSVTPEVAEGFAGYLVFRNPDFALPPNTFLLDDAFTYLQDGDIVRLHPSGNSLRVLYRRNSLHNSFLLTEQCNNFCLMCSQPPKAINDSYLVDEILQTIPLIDPATASLGITGGEPSLLKDRFIAVLQSLASKLPETATHVLSNGRAFSDLKLAKEVAAVGNKNLMFGIPLYSDLAQTHDYVVQAAGAYNDTIRGIINLKSCGLRVEIRVVIHSLTYDRLPELARFIRRNLTFCDHVALMGLEMTGFTKMNLEKLWIDPKDYQAPLKEAVRLLFDARIPVSIYNHQLCILDPWLHPFNVKSISDWKNVYMEECADCTRKAECGGFFSSSKLRYSRGISPFREYSLLT